MPRTKCPLCRTPIDVFGLQTFSRLSCDKCHADLHLGTDGKLLVGHPPVMDSPFDELKQGLMQWASRFPVGKVVTWGTVILVVVLGTYNLFGPAERLDSIAEKAAQAIANDDPEALKSLADSGSSDEIQRWYDAMHSRLVQLRSTWGEKAEAVEAHVAIASGDEHKGAATLAIHPTTNGARDISLADPSSATASASVPFEVLTDWTLTRWGRWKIDGKATYARLSPTPGTP